MCADLAGGDLSAQDLLDFIMTSVGMKESVTCIQVQGWAFFYGRGSPVCWYSKTCFPESSPFRFLVSEGVFL